MIIQITLSLFLGIIFGTLTGLIPGLHINMISTILVTISFSIFYKINTIYLMVFIISMSITHTFLDFIPSIFLGCPDTDTELSILPGHQLLKEGKGLEAIQLANKGSFIAIISILIISYPIIRIIPIIYNLTNSIIPYILILISASLIFSEKRKINSLFVFILTGILGSIVLNLESIKEPLLPLLSGLFGSSSLLISIKNKTEIPLQEKNIKRHKINFKKISIPIIIASICSFLPGIGTGQATIISNQISKSSIKEFIFMNGLINTVVMGISFLTLYSINKTRTGSALAIKSLLPEITPQILILSLLTIFLSGLISYFLTKKISISLSKKIHKINYTLTSISILIILTIIILIFSNIIGLGVYIISTLTGYYCIELGVKRTNLMGCLIIPTIIIYLI